jgi:pilus assembly protein CpaE
MEGFKEKIKVIVNRVGLEAGQISLKKAQETIAREIFWQIPNDYRAMSEVRNNGTPLGEVAPRAGITQAISALADSLSGIERDPSDIAGALPQANRWLSFWPTKSKAKTK